MSSFGFGGGMGGGMGGGIFSSPTSSQSPAAKKEKVDYQEVTKMLKLKLCLSILCQELFYLSSLPQDKPDGPDRWKSFKEKIELGMNDLATHFDVDKSLLMKKLKQ